MASTIATNIFLLMWRQVCVHFIAAGSYQSHVAYSSAYDNGQSSDIFLPIYVFDRSSQIYSDKIYYTLSMESHWVSNTKTSVRIIFNSYHKHCYSYSYMNMCHNVNCWLHNWFVWQIMEKTSCLVQPMGKVIGTLMKLIYICDWICERSLI